MSKDKNKKKKDKKEKKEKKKEKAQVEIWRGDVKEAGQYLKNVRMTQALNQNDVAEKADVSQGVVSAAECGSGRISVRAMQGVAGALGFKMRIVFEKNKEG